MAANGEVAFVGPRGGATATPCYRITGVPGAGSPLGFTPLRAYPDPMAVMTVQLQLEDDLVHGIRELAAARGEPEDAVVTQALASFLGCMTLYPRFV